MSLIRHPLKGPLWVPHFRRGWVSAEFFLLQQQQLTIRETAVQTRRIRPIYSDHVPGGIRLAFKWNIHPFPPLLDRGKFILKQNWTHSYLRYICATRKPPHMYFSNKYTRWRGVFRRLSQHENLEFSTNLCAFPFKGVISIDTAWRKTSRWILPLTRLNGNFCANTK